MQRLCFRSAAEVLAKGKSRWASAEKYNKRELVIPAYLQTSFGKRIKGPRRGCNGVRRRITRAVWEWRSLLKGSLERFACIWSHKKFGCAKNFPSRKAENSVTQYYYHHRTSFNFGPVRRLFCTSKSAPGVHRLLRNRFGNTEVVTVRYAICTASISVICCVIRSLISSE